MNKLLFLIFFSGSLLSCSQAEKTETRTFNESLAVIDFEEEVEGDWGKVCFLPPYTNNDLAKQILGFEFDVEANSGVYVLDSVTLVVLVKHNKALRYFETPRNNIDFAFLKAGCYSRQQAKFKIVKDKHGWPNAQRT